MLWEVDAFRRPRGGADGDAGVGGGAAGKPREAGGRVCESWTSVPPRPSLGARLPGSHPVGCMLWPEFNLVTAPWRDARSRPQTAHGRELQPSPCWVPRLHVSARHLACGHQLTTFITITRPGTSRRLCGRVPSVPPAPVPSGSTWPPRGPQLHPPMEQVPSYPDGVGGVLLGAGGASWSCGGCVCTHGGNPESCDREGPPTVLGLGSRLAVGAGVCLGQEQDSSSIFDRLCACGNGVALCATFTAGPTTTTTTTTTTSQPSPRVLDLACSPAGPRPRAAAAAASKRRESPEGDSFVVSAFASGRKGMEEVERRGGGGEHRVRDKQELPSGDPKEGLFREDQCPLEVALPAEKAEGLEGPGQLFGVDDGERAANREAPRGLSKKRLDINALQCDVSVEEDNSQEWTFTLYGFDHSGKATREDMSSLMHTIYEVVDASVNHSSGSSKTLRVKLTVSPEPSSKRKEGPSAGQDREPARSGMEGEPAEDPRVADKRLSAHVRRPSADPHPCPVRGPYCVDENTERRNHYLDLAGIENYTSKFGPGSPPAQAKQEHQGKASCPQSRSRSQEPDAHTAHHRRSQVLADHTLLTAEPAARALDGQPRLKGQEKQFLKSPKGSGRPPGGPGGSKSGRTFSYHPPAALLQGPQDGHHLQQPPPQPYGHKRYRQRGREGHSPLKAALGQPAVVEHEVVRDLPPVLLGEGYAVPVVQRHEHHHHHHEHHHHHHYHHHPHS
ncbi:PREDICTED: protein naked cuticle homolog 2 [Ceratotherium simum simum]|uniref:Protein naked cuticle homolog n=1 Tax=Ceratotherium simum simum TaxID=73337 RepID=A0ABM1DFB9_CERSS|nr:PREDICTED: protein naked cuticle homolog 2 [Ceratotherium simum simum]